MNIHPLASFIKSIRAYEAGQIDEAEKNLAESLGFAELTPYMKDHLKIYLDADNLNNAVLTLLIDRSRRNV